MNSETTNERTGRAGSRTALHVTSAALVYLIFLAPALWLLIGGAQVLWYAIDKGYTLGGEIVATCLTISDAVLIAVMAVLTVRVAKGALSLNRYLLVAAITVFVYFPIEFLMLVGLLQ